jgi:hypothetical protein
VNTGANTAPQTFVFDHNLWYAHDNPAASAPSLPAPETGQIAGLDPLFVPGGYQVREASPAAHSGAAVQAGTPDLAGRCRPDPPSRGAYEPCDANCDASTTPPLLNVLDFICFLNRFGEGSPYANCDGSTAPPVLNVLDLNCFLNRFAAGCP